MAPETSLDSAPSHARRFRWRQRGILFLILAAAFLLRARMLEVPLERDEGVYAYIARLILQGVPLYSEAADLQMPGLWLAYAAAMRLFHQTAVAIHLGLLIVNLATVWIVFLLGRRLGGPVVGLAAAAGYAILSISQKLLGFTANAEHFILLPALAGVLFVLRAEESKRHRDFFLSGLLTGLGLAVKQQGLFFVAFAGAYALYCDLRERPIVGRRLAQRLGFFALGALAPFGSFCVWFAFTGALGKFFFWAFEYSSTYASNISISSGVRNLAATGLPFLGHSSLFWLLAAVGLFAVWADRQIRPRAVFLVAFLLFSFLSVCPGLYFRHHYWILLLPAVALLAAVAIRSLSRLLFRRFGRKAAVAGAAALTLAAVAQMAVAERDFLFRLSPEEVCRTTYFYNPFVESVEIGRYIRQRTASGDRVAILGSEPQILFYAQRNSAAKMIVMYPLMWAPPQVALRMQQDTIREIEAARPKFLVFVNVATSWIPKKNSERLIFDWFSEYCREGYQRVGVVDIAYPKPSLFVWGQNAPRYKPRTECGVYIFQRQEAPASSAPASGPASQPASEPASEPASAEP